MHWGSIKNYSNTSGAGSGRVGPVRAEWGWGGVGHAITLRRPGYKAKWGRVAVEPVRAEWGWGGAWLQG